MKQKKRIKKHSNEGQYRRVCEVILRDTALVLTGNDNLVTLTSIKKRRPITLEPLIYKAIKNVPYQWSVYIAVFCRDQLGRRYINSQWINAQSRYYQRDLIGVLNENHRQLLDSANQLHVLNYGWVAIPSGGVITDEHANALMELYQPWDSQTQWEIKQEIKALEQQEQPLLKESA